MADKVGFFVGDIDHRLVTVNDNRQIKDIFVEKHGVENFFEAITKASSEAVHKHKKMFHDALVANHLSESEVALVLPDSQCALQIITLPTLTEKEILSAIELQADEFIPYPIEKAQYDYQVINTDKKNNTMSILILVSMKDQIKAIEEYMLELGLYPVSIESVSTSLFKVILDKNFNFTQELVLLMNIETTATQVSLISIKQQLVLMTYSFNLGEGFFVRGVQNYKNCSYEEAQTQFENFKTDDKDLLSISQSLLNEYCKEVDKIVTSANEKIGVKPRLMIFHGSGAKTFKSLFGQLEKDTYPEILVLSPLLLAEKKMLSFSRDELKAKSDTVLPAISTCLE